LRRQLAHNPPHLLPTHQGPLPHPPPLNHQVATTTTTTSSTLLPLPHPTVVPGDRFRETYYWDSLWVVQGLLVSGMHSTAKGVVGNLMHLLATLGHVPNGARAYYLTRRWGSAGRVFLWCLEGTWGCFSMGETTSSMHAAPAPNQPTLHSTLPCSNHIT